MRKLLLSLMFLGFLGSISPIFAVNELPSCEDLATLADTLEELRDEFAKLQTVEVDGHLDQTLGDLVTALEDVARIEQDQKLSKAISSLAKSWEDMNMDTFGLSLDSVITNFDRILRNECD